MSAFGRNVTVANRPKAVIQIECFVVDMLRSTEHFKAKRAEIAKKAALARRKGKT
jgi:hypothetical protein